MRIVYDDTAQSEMIKAVERFMGTLDVKRIVRYEWGTDRVQMHILREKLNLFLEQYRMSIGNNCNYPVYYWPETENELQQCGSININTGMYGEGFVSCEDYNGKIISAVYEVRKYGIKITRREPE